jgi:putative phosphotransacetylase
MEQSQLIELIAREIIARLQAEEANANDLSIPLGISNRHIHLSQADLDVLFGVGYTLSELRPLSQPGQYAAKETVCIAGYKGCFNNVRVLGPVRQSSQIEISRSDAYTLGAKAPVRLSGDTTGAGTVCVIGPAGMLVMSESLIIAKRHIHMPPKDALRFGVNDNDVVAVKAEGERACVFEDVVVRVSPDFSLELHLDTDEANSADLSNGSRFRIQVESDGVGSSNAHAASVGAAAPAVQVQTAQARATQPVSQMPPVQSDCITVDGKLITYSDVQGIPKDSCIVIAQDAKITPLAKDYIAERRLELRRR